MGTSVFTIRGQYQAFFNLDTAIHAAKDLVKSSVVSTLKIHKELAEKFHYPYADAYSDKNLRRCPLRYTVVKGKKDNEIRVRARINIPISNSVKDSRKNMTISRSVIIEMSQMTNNEKDIEYVFDSKESEVIFND